MPHRLPRAAAPRQLGQRLKRGLGGAIDIDQLPERRRADIVAADQPQPAQPLTVGKLHAAPGAWRIKIQRQLPAQPFAPILDSVPAISRWILALCLTKMIKVMRPQTEACSQGAETNSAASATSAAVSAESEE